MDQPTKDDILRRLKELTEIVTEIPVTETFTETSYGTTNYG